ncbi:MAG: PIG-L family deacetylase [Bacteroidia bacterium]|nr:PIG-L family deacetylase [Bacteroidia bacterium]
MEIPNNKRVLVLAPHTDDGEFGCGGTISKLIENGNDVYCAAFSACQQSVLKQFPADILITEVKAASSVLGVKGNNLILFDYEVRTFNYRRQEILDDIIKLRLDIKPDLIFMPSMNDIHQDHCTIAQEGLRAFKFSSILCYEVPWNNLTFNTSAFSILDDCHLQKKIDALKEYKSQAHRNYANEEFIRSLARTRGVQIDTRYAECFEVIRWIL